MWNVECGVWYVVCGGTTLPTGHIQLVKTDLVSGAWLTGGIISSYIADRRQGRKRQTTYKDNHYSQQTIY